MVSAAIAYRELAETHPALVERIVTIMKSHPQADEFEARMSSVGGSEADRQLTLFMFMGRWPDDIRDNPTFHHSAWHYVNIPYKPEAGDDLRDAPPPAGQNIFTTFSHNLHTLADATVDDSEKAASGLGVVPRAEHPL